MFWNIRAFIGDRQTGSSENYWRAKQDENVGQSYVKHGCAQILNEIFENIHQFGVKMAELGPPEVKEGDKLKSSKSFMKWFLE
jgi:hypothetical protein